MIKKTTETKKTPSKKKQTNKDTKTSKKTSVVVIQKSTQPKVIVETKSLKKENYTPTSLMDDTKKNKKLGKILIGIITLLTIVNFILLWYGISLIKEQRDFNITSHGGIENYNMIKELYNTVEFQQLSTSNTYKLIEQVNQVSQQ